MIAAKIKTPESIVDGLLRYDNKSKSYVLIFTTNDRELQKLIEMDGTQTYVMFVPEEMFVEMSTKFVEISTRRE